MPKKRKPTSDAIEILHRRYYQGKPKRLAELEEVRVEDKLARFENLWTVDAAKYALVRVGGEAGDLSRFIIFNVETRTAMVIEDNDLSQLVKRRMKDAGVPLLNRLP